jgi:hypothetical protein
MIDKERTFYRKMMIGRVIKKCRKYNDKYLTFGFESDSTSFFRLIGFYERDDIIHIL